MRGTSKASSLVLGGLLAVLVARLVGQVPSAPDENAIRPSLRLLWRADAPDKEHGVHRVAFSADGGRVAFVAFDHLWVGDIDRGTLRKSVACRDVITGLEGSEVLTANAKGLAWVDARSDEVVRTEKLHDLLRVHGVEPAERRGRIAVARGEMFLATPSLSIVGAGGTTETVVEGFARTYAAEWSSDGNWLATATCMPSCRLPALVTFALRDAEGQVVKSATGQVVRDASVSFSPDGRHLVWTQWKSVQRASVPEMRVTQMSAEPTLWWKHIDAELGVSHDGKAVTFWDVAAFKPVRRVEVGEVMRLGVGEKAVASGGSGETEEVVAQFVGSGRRVWVAALARDRSRLALAGMQDVAVYEIVR